jgi:thiol-disulfide isomerase/thioredoxin
MAILENNVLQNHLLLTKPFAEKASFETIASNLSYMGINDNTDKITVDFKQLYPDSKYTAIIEKLYNAKLDLMEGRPAKQFEVLDTKGNTLTLNKLKGKVIYIDFWSSVCLPCIKEMKLSKNIKEHFKGNDKIVFLYISLDESEKLWLKTLAKLEVEGTHCRAVKGMEDAITKNYGISAVPSCYIIGKDGNFKAIQPPRPSTNNGKDLIKILENALDEK